ncbi:YkgJ family cysteine cluster protein [Candidatus Woesearchaeota archaeon]|nr:YkgJ family cysteine cluster protein [Candidatus Woesearchaeota archaeon]
MQTVKVSAADIARIEKLGHRREDFLDVEPVGTRHLKIEDDYCVFYRHGKRADGKALGICTLYGNRPDNCRKYPGKEECTMYKDPVFTHFISRKMPSDVEIPRPLAELDGKELIQIQKLWSL